MVSCEGMPCFRGGISFSCVWCSFPKLAMSTQSSAFAVMAKNDRAMISLRGYLILLCWRVSVWSIIFRCDSMFSMVLTVLVSFAMYPEFPAFLYLRFIFDLKHS